MVSINPRKQFFVDCGVSYDSPIVISGATKTDPIVITTTTNHGFIDGDLVDILEVKGMTELNGQRFKVVKKTDTTFELTDPEDDSDIDGTAFTTYESGGEVRKAITTIPGLAHLNGKEVIVLADGSVIEGNTVADGEITLTTAASIVHVGLPYISDLEPLHIEFNLPSGTTQSKLVQISQVEFYFLYSSGGWLGPDAEHLDEIVLRTDEAMGSPEDLYTGSHAQPITGDYRKGARVFFRQVDPLPVTILAVIPKVTVGG
jgi:hypothetical protein